MPSEKLLGVLTADLNLPPDAFTATIATSIPLFEGGMSYQGSLSRQSEFVGNDLDLLIAKQVLDMAVVESIEPSAFAEPRQYRVRLSDSDIFRVTAYTTTADPQQFYGMVTTEEGTRIGKFTYRDINEPISMGVVVIVVAGIAALNCLIPTLVAQHKGTCKAIKLTYGFKFNWRNPATSIGCHLDCLD